MWIHALACLFALVSPTENDEGPPPGFEPLFNGVDLDGFYGLDTSDPRAWRALPDEERALRKQKSLLDLARHWSVENGELVNDGKGLYLTTEREFEDFELMLQYRTVAGADSGIYLRGIPQVQIWDTTAAGGKWPLGADRGSGGLWNNSAGAPGKDPLVHADRPFGEWNAVHVRMIGERVTVWLNGSLVVDHARLENYFDRSLPVPRQGPIQLQTHGGEIRWRSLYVRSIPPDEANAILWTQGGGGFAPVFDGSSFDGWLGPLDGWVVEDGAMRCRPDNGGTIFTSGVYGDFSARFEVKIPPGGNNGVAVRYPGEGDTAYVGMCELQVLDDSAAKYAQLDARQYHGSAYGMAPAHRGYQRTPGSWNFQEVTVIGSRVTVELNGTRILDADLAAVTDFLAPEEKFLGRLRTEGHFGFAGHGDPVSFRNVAIRPIEAEAEASALEAADG